MGEIEEAKEKLAHSLTVSPESPSSALKSEAPPAATEVEVGIESETLLPCSKKYGMTRTTRCVSPE